MRPSPHRHRSAPVTNSICGVPDRTENLPPGSFSSGGSFDWRNSSGSFATLTASHRASFLVSRLAAGPACPALAGLTRGRIFRAYWTLQLGRPQNNAGAFLL